MSAMVQDWISRAAQADPQALAVVGEAETLTYGDIEAYSNRLARTLLRLGCRHGDRVGAHMPRSARSAASVIGILKAGCVYVPIDPMGAAARTATILRQCDPSVVLFEGCGPAAIQDLEHYGALRGVVTVWLGPDDSARPTTIRRRDIDLASAHAVQSPHAGPNDLVSILFPSGTTDVSTTVRISHATLRAFIEWGVRFLDLGPTDRISGDIELPFDRSAFDMYASFASGAQLHRVPTQARTNPREFVNLLDERALTAWFSSPSHLSSVARSHALAGRRLPALRHVACCGDVLPTSVLRRWKERLPGVEFTHLSSPTGTTTAGDDHTAPADSPIRPTAPMGAVGADDVARFDKSAHTDRPVRQGRKPDGPTAGTVTVGLPPGRSGGA